MDQDKAQYLVVCLCFDNFGISGFHFFGTSGFHDCISGFRVFDDVGDGYAHIHNL